MNSYSMKKFTLRMVDFDSETAERGRLLIAESFRSRLNAYPNLNNKKLIVLESIVDGVPTIGACSTITFANEQKLFSEIYLSNKIEKAVSNDLNSSISRSLICEIGSLSTNSAFIPSVRSIVAYFPWFAKSLGCSFALVTVTSYIRTALEKSGGNFKSYCYSDPLALSASERSLWGNYYQFEPQTGIIDIRKLSFLDKTVSLTSQANEFTLLLPSYEKAEACL